MTREGFLKIKVFFKGHIRLLYTAAAISKLSELAVYVSYPLFLLLLIINKNLYCIQSMLVCGIGFVLLTLFRKYINAERPYERYDFAPLIKKETSGNSFPSRHVFSAAVIGMSMLPVFSVWGAVILVLSLITALLRVLLGIHFIKDTVAGFLIGVMIGLFSFI